MIKKIFFLLLTLLLIAAGSILFIVHQGQIPPYPSDIIYRGNTVLINVNPCPLQPGSLSVESIFAEKSLSDWNQRQHVESYHFLETIAEIWRKQELVEDFMVLGTIPPRMNSNRFFWEISPFTKTSKFSDLFLVVWRLIFNSQCLTSSERQSIKDKYHPYQALFSQQYQVSSEKTTCPPADVFCEPAIIDKQLLYEGELVDLLYNYSPIGIGEEKLHFLLISKAHRSGFPELTLNEYLEAQDIASKLIRYYREKGFPIVYIFHKTGKLAGQTVPHWHEHLIFAPDEASAFFGKLQVLRKMLLPSSPLSNQELEVLVKKYRQQVQEALKK